MTYDINALRTLAKTKLNAEEVYDLGMALLNHKMGVENSIYAAEFLQFAAEKGNVAAMYDLGMCYCWGDGGVYAEPETALVWCRKAAEAGHEKAKALVARYDNSQGKMIMLMSAMSGNGGQGSKWYKTKSGVDMYYEKAKAGDGEAQYELALQLSNPDHIGPFKYNIEEAVYWYTESGNNGVIDAMFNLAHIYLYGKGTVPKDKAKAREWFEKCANAGDAEAAELLKKESLWED